MSLIDRIRKRLGRKKGRRTSIRSGPTQPPGKEYNGVKRIIFKPDKSKVILSTQRGEQKLKPIYEIDMGVSGDIGGRGYPKVEAIYGCKGGKAGSATDSFEVRFPTDAGIPKIYVHHYRNAIIIHQSPNKTW